MNNYFEWGDNSDNIKKRKAAKWLYWKKRQVR